MLLWILALCYLEIFLSMNRRYKRSKNFQKFKSNIQFFSKWLTSLAPPPLPCVRSNFVTELWDIQNKMTPSLSTSPIACALRAQSLPTHLLIKCSPRARLIKKRHLPFLLKTRHRTLFRDRFLPLCRLPIANLLAEYRMYSKKHISTRSRVEFWTKRMEKTYWYHWKMWPISRSFRGAHSAHKTRAFRYWHERQSIVKSYQPNGRENNGLTVFSSTKIGLRSFRVKVAPGWVRKQEAWMDALYDDWLQDFEMLRSCGLNFYTNFLLLWARELDSESTSDLYGPTIRDKKSDKLVSDHV